MHYVSVENLSKSFGTKPLFKQISFHISEGDKIAFIAKNGSGKSTLLKILAAKEHADSGTVWIHKDVSIALFEQEPVFEETKSVIDNIFNFNHPSIEIIKAYELACEAEDADAISNAIEKMDELNAWDFDTKVKQILGKLRIHNYDQLVSTLSGGQRKRVALAQTLINIGFEHKHVLLIMDEPTNHLDVEMIEWLEHYLNQEKVTLLLVSHDRYFLDAVCEEIWELDESELFVYKGDYENYIEKKAARIENQAASIDKAKNTYRKELEWMRKQPKARTTKSKSREDNFYEVEAKAKELEQGFLPTSGVAGAIRRKISGWAGDPTYIELSKDLANVQIGNLKALGGSMDTVAGQSLQKYANGDETYPPDVLIKIVRRNKADLTNIDMQATAAQRFKQQFGDNNMNKFKQDWSKNADSKVFEAINISKEITDPKEKEKEYNKLFPNPSDRKEFLEKYRNLKKLSETGSL